MLLAGDEFARTQQGNNNAYCQDSEISWLNWNIEPKGQPLIRFAQRLTGLRHKFPILPRNRFLTGEFNEQLGVKDVTWINANGAEMEDTHWGDSSMRCFGMLIDGRAQATGLRQRGKEATLLMIINGHHDLVEFTLPEFAESEIWSLMIDTNIEDNREESTFRSGDKYGVTGRSLLLFALESKPA